MSRPKPNLTPAQRKAYDARMRQLRQQQQKRRRVTPKVTVGTLGTGTTKRKLTAEQQKKMREAVLRQQKAISAMTPQQRKKLQREAKQRQRKTVRDLREKHNKTAQEKQYLAVYKKSKQQQRRQRMINKQRRNAQNIVTKPKAPPKVLKLTDATRRQVVASLRASQKARGRG
tara:strand:- start:71 stop:586 length:516 start_codon:yes stop_codon:yes gene_type:complete